MSLVLRSPKIGAPAPLTARHDESFFSLDIVSINLKYHREDLNQRPFDEINMPILCRCRCNQTGYEKVFSSNLVLNAGDVTSVAGIPIGSLILGTVEELKGVGSVVLEVSFEGAVHNCEILRADVLLED